MYMCGYVRMDGLTNIQHAYMYIYAYVCKCPYVYVFVLRTAITFE